MRNLTISAVLLALLTVGCGVVQGTVFRNAEPPQALAEVDHQRIPLVINGYQWSDGSHMTIADAAFDPAQNLKVYHASSGAEVKLVLQQHPNSLQLSEWFNGTQVGKQFLHGPTFRLKARPGNYIYEITGFWGKDYVNYDFEVKVAARRQMH